MLTRAALAASALALATAAGKREAAGLSAVVEGRQPLRGAPTRAVELGSSDAPFVSDGAAAADNGAPAADRLPAGISMTPPRLGVTYTALQLGVSQPGFLAVNASTNFGDVYNYYMYTGPGGFKASAEH